LRRLFLEVAYCNTGRFYCTADSTCQTAVKATGEAFLPNELERRIRSAHMRD
jgi:hypothetical protein